MKPLGTEPLWLRSAAGIIRRLPAGRYRAANRLRRPTAFVARLPRSLGAFSYRCDLADAICREVYFTGCYEPQETQIGAALVRRGDVVLDIGANWGYFTLAAAHWVGSGGRVVAFEPDPRLFARLTENVRMNQLPGVSTEQRAAGAAAGTVKLIGYRDGEDNRGVTRSARAGEADADFTAPVVALDDWLAANGIPRARLVKIDIEGDEGKALDGLRRTLDRRAVDYLLIECHPRELAAQGGSATEALTPLRSAGYSLWSVDQSFETHRRAARRTMTPGQLLGPFDDRAAQGTWPHVLAAAPGCGVPR